MALLDKTKQLRHKYRYFAYILTILMLLFEMISSFGITLAMLGGLAKQDCNDPNDSGEYCWSEPTKAAIIAAYYYGNWLQVLPTTLAKKFGFTLTTRIIALVDGIIQLTFPFYVGYSIPLTLVLQGLRGMLGGIFFASSMEFTRKWGIGSECKTFIAFAGIAIQLGNGMGPSIAGFISTYIGWRYFFYMNGLSYIALLVLTIIFVPERPQTAWAMSEQEKALFEDKQKALIRSTSEHRSESAPQDLVAKIKDILSRAYVIAFIIFALMDCFQLQALFACTPFFLHDILGASTPFISCMSIIGSLATVACTIFFTSALPWLDQRFPWFWCRLCIMATPQALRTVLYLGIAFVPNKWLVATMVIIVLTSWGTTFSGSIVTVNYEIDPKKAPITLALINGIGQLCGFIVPLLRAAITDVEKHLPIYRQRWQLFYCLTAGSSAIAMTTILLVMKLWPEEFQKHHTLLAEEEVKKEFKGEFNKGLEVAGNETIVMENHAAQSD